MPLLTITTATNPSTANRRRSSTPRYVCGLARPPSP
jgi:hypothetical protein